MRTKLTAVFVTALVTAQVISSKLVALPMGIVVPGGTLAYAFTFIATDSIGEIYGKQEARETVLSGFLMNFLLLGLIYATIKLPSAGGVPEQAFNSVLLSSGNIVLGSLGAFIISQTLDVEIFHRLRKKTDGAYLWSRNIPSTAISQAVDTVVFTGVAFFVAPLLFGIGQPLPIAVIWSLIVGQTLAKIVIAILDTPIVYGVVLLANRPNA